MNNSLISSIASVTGVIAAILLALNINMFLVAYVLFLISAILWAIYSIRTSNNQLLIMNAIFIVINSIGVYNFS
jgi:hypothetical protein